MRAYWQLAVTGFRRSARYRTAVWASVLTNSVFGLIRASMLLTAIATVGHDVGGYDAAQAATYVWLSQALLGPLDVWGASVDLGRRIRTGDVAVDLQRPVSILGASLATTAGRAVFDLLPRGIPPLVVGWLVTGLRLPTQPSTWLVGFVSVVMATALCHCYYVAVHLSALWTVQNRGFLVIAMVVQQVLSGFVVPVSWFPSWLGRAARLSPFPGMFQTPVDVLTHRITGTGIGLTLLTQLGWSAVLVGVCQLLLAAGRRKVVIQGG